MSSWPSSSGDILLFAEQAPLAERLAIALTPYTPRVLTLWRAVEAHAARARCIVLADQRPITSGLPARAQRLGQRHRETPILIVTTPTPEHVRAFLACGMRDILWVHDTPSILHGAIDGAVRRQPLDALAVQLQSATHLPLYLRNTLAYLCRASHCVRTVHELCRAAGCHRSTLWAQWRAVGGDTVLRLQDVVDWVLLLRTCSSHAPGINWSAAALEAGVHEHTIARIAKRLMRCSLRDLRHPLPVTSVHSALLEALAPLLTERAPRYEPGVTGVRTRAANDA